MVSNVTILRLIADPCWSLLRGGWLSVQRMMDDLCRHSTLNSIELLSNGAGLTHENTSDEIRRLDAGSKFDSSFAGEHTPSLDVILRAMAK